MENSFALCPGSPTLDRFGMEHPFFQTEMSEEPIDDIELEEAEPVDESFLDVSLVEEVNSNSQENNCFECRVIP
jgi:hypothetical protein